MRCKSYSSIQSNSRNSGTDFGGSSHLNASSTFVVNSFTLVASSVRTYVSLGETHKSWTTSEILSMAPQPSLSHMVMSWRPSKRQFEASWLAHQNQLVFMDLAGFSDLLSIHFYLFCVYCFCLMTQSWFHYITWNSRDDFSQVCEV